MSKYFETVQLYHRIIKKALLEEWDPIGVAEIPEAQDEYDSYISSIYKMLMSKNSRKDVFNYLWWLETEHMGLIGDRQKTEKFTDKLFEIINNIPLLIK